MNDKRTNQRFVFETEVEIDHGDATRTQGKIVNMSTGGVLLETDPLPKYGTKLTLHFQLPGVPNPCAIPCIVRWIKPGKGAGLQFESLRPIEMWAVNRLKRELTHS